VSGLLINISMISSRSLCTAKQSAINVDAIMLSHRLITLLPAPRAQFTH